MSTEPQPRPGQATLAGALIIGGSVAVVLAAWQRISSLHTLEVQEELQRVLAEPPFSGLDIGVDGFSSVVRVLCMLAAGSATAAAILGFQVYKRSRSARIALSALAPVLLVGGFATSGFFAPLAVAGITLLWLQPTRDWYAGRPWLQRFEERRAERLAALRPPGQQASPGAGESGAATAAGSRPDTGGEPGAPGQPGPAHQPAPARRRPAALAWACVLTWTTSAFVAVVMLASIPRLIDGDTLDEQAARLEEQQGRSLESMNLTEDTLLAAMLVIVGGLVLWCVAAIVLAVLAFGGRNWARITLAVSGGCAAAATVLAAIAGPPLLLVAALVGIGTWLLLRPEVSAWFRR